MNWLVFLMMGTLTWAGHNVCVKILAERLPAALITTMYYLFSLASVTILLLVLKPKFEVGQLTQPTTLALLAGAGMGIGFADFFLAMSFNSGAPLSVAFSAFAVGGITLTAIASIVIMG